MRTYESWFCFSWNLPPLIPTHPPPPPPSPHSWEDGHWLQELTSELTGILHPPPPSKKDLKTSQALGAGNADIITICCMHALLLFVWFWFRFHTANCLHLYYCWSDTAKAWSSKLSCCRGHWRLIIPGNMAVFLSGKERPASKGWPLFFLLDC